MIVKGRNVHVNMQRRQLELIASVINDIPADSEVTRNTVAAMFADSLRRENVNDNFDVSRFVKACVREQR